MTRQTRLRPEQGGRFHPPVDARPRDANGVIIDCLTYGDDGMVARWRPVSAPVALGFTRECCWCQHVGDDVKPSYQRGDPECLECFKANTGPERCGDRDRELARKERDRHV